MSTEENKHLKMVRNIKRKWINALLSGKFKQGQNKLKSIDDTYCCLGVLLCVIDNKRWTLRESKTWINQDEWHHKRQAKSDDYLSGSLLKELNISADDQRRLANMNDSKISFRKIAAWIEENL